MTVAYMQRAPHERLQNYESKRHSRFLRDTMQFQFDFKPSSKRFEIDDCGRLDMISWDFVLDFN